MARKAKTVAVEEPVDFGQMIAAVPIEVWPLEDVILDPNNANVHDRRSIDAIKASIAKFGQVEPLILRKSTGILIAGEGRWVAMQELGFAHVEVRPLDVDATTAAMLSLTLNRTAELSHFDFENVAAQLKGFKADGHDLGVLGWADFELQPLLEAKWEPRNPSSGGDANPNGDEDSTHAVVFSSGQWAVISQAINRIRTNENDSLIANARAIELIVADWMSGT